MEIRIDKHILSNLIDESQFLANNILHWKHIEDREYYNKMSDIMKPKEVDLGNIGDKVWYSFDMKEVH